MPVRVSVQFNEDNYIRSSWDRILLNNSKLITQLDITSSYDWVSTLKKTRLNKTDVELVSLEQDGSICGIIPLYRSSEKLHPFRVRVLTTINELYYGRTGFIIDKPVHENLSEMLYFILKKDSHWDIFRITLLEGSESETSMLKIAKQYGYTCEKLSPKISPYIVLESNWECFFQSLPKKLRWTIRKSEQRLKEKGQLNYRKFTTPSDVEIFFNAVLEIEKESWKETAGTSITSNDYQEEFYRQFTPLAAKNGYFSGHILELNDEPIAYVYGFNFNGIFYDLKESYKQQYRNLSPGHVLKKFVFQTLYDLNVKIYDFMGVCEDYKMRWTDKTYSNSTYILYNSTIKGKMLSIRSKIASSLKQN